MRKEYEQTLLQRRSTNGNKHMKKCPTSLAIKDNPNHMGKHTHHEVPLLSYGDGYD